MTDRSHERNSVESVPLNLGKEVTDGGLSFLLASC